MDRKPSLEEIEGNLAKNLGVDNICVRWLVDQNARLRERLAALDDDALADRIAQDCHDKDHDDRWCQTCAARSDGIEAYREALKEAAAKAKDPQDA